MGDAVRVRDLQRIGNLGRVAQKLIQRGETGIETFAERLTLHKRHDQISDLVLLANIVKRADMRMRQRRDRPRFPLEPQSCLGITRQLRTDDFQRHMARQPGIRSSVNFPHPARPELRHDLVRPQPRARRESHMAVKCAVRIPCLFSGGDGRSNDPERGPVEGAGAKDQRRRRDFVATE